MGEQVKLVKGNVKPFHATGLFLHPLKTENQSFSNVFRGRTQRPGDQQHEMV